eukprot:500357-Prorocentrum_minimum.AAC.5
MFRADRYGKVCGFHGVVAAFVVAIKQLMPEHEVRLMGVVRFRLKVFALAPLCHTRRVYSPVVKQDPMFWLVGAREPYLCSRDIWCASLVVSVASLCACRTCRWPSYCASSCSTSRGSPSWWAP